jgi:hypothetical protein
MSPKGTGIPKNLYVFKIVQSEDVIILGLCFSRDLDEFATILHPW